ncbi:unnamed protein product [Phaeothamnion confervicola]
MFSYLTYSLAIDTATEYAILFVTIVVAGFLVHRGLAELGRTEELIFVLSASPFYVLIAASLFQLDIDALLRMPQNISYSVFFQVVFWSATYLQRQSVLAAEVQECERNLPRGLLMAGLAGAFVNALGFFAICGANSWLPYDDWTTGTFKDMADINVGTWLGWWIVAGSVFSCVGATIAGLNATVFSVLGQAERGWLPRGLARRGAHGTPAAAIALIASVMMAMQLLELTDIIAIDNFFYCTFTVLELCAFARLRFTQPDLPRPFRVPLAGGTGAAVVVPPLIVVCIVVFFAGEVAWIIGPVGLFLGVCIVGFASLRRMAKPHWAPVWVEPLNTPSGHGCTAVAGVSAGGSGRSFGCGGVSGSGRGFGGGEDGDSIGGSAGGGRNVAASQGEDKGMRRERPAGPGNHQECSLEGEMTRIRPVSEWIDPPPHGQKQPADAGTPAGSKGGGPG